MAVYSNKKLSEVKPDKTKVGLNIIVDTREQKPLWNPPVCKRECLIVGDYTTRLLNNKFIAERKSPGDLYGTITKGHRRFKREIFRAIENDIIIVVFVETTKKRFINKRFPGGANRQYPSKGLERIVDTLASRYDLEFVWCKDRAEMKKLIIERFKQEERKLKLC